MECLYCGDCCLRLAPLIPCPSLVSDGDFYFCMDYKGRPKQCKNHTYYGRFCPIGITKLKLDNPMQVSVRIDEGYRRSVRFC
jgi:hypothetical protein